MTLARTKMDPTIEPKMLKIAFKHPNWVQERENELEALHHKHTWTLVSCPNNENVVGYKWVFKTKYKMV